MENLKNAWTGMPAPNPERRRRRERGSALIVVLSALLIAGVLTLSVVSLSKLSYRSSAVSTDRSEAAYIAEGAAARAQWLLMFDLKNFRDRQLYAEQNGLQKAQDALSSALSDWERLIGNGQTHKFDYYGEEISFTLNDMIGEIDISGAGASDKLRDAWTSRYQDFDEYESFLEFVDCLNDYTDRDENRRLKGAEAPDYDYPNLPRNDKMAYREEVLLVKNAGLFFQPDADGRLRNITPIPPSGMASLDQAQKTAKMSFFNADAASLRRAGFNETEISLILQARDAFQSSGAALEDTLAPELIARLKNNFSFKESGYFSFKVTAGRRFKRSLFFSLKVEERMRTDGNLYYEWSLQ